VWITALLAATLLWQNPLFVASELVYSLSTYVRLISSIIE
jgi:hypothetical protein